MNRKLLLAFFVLLSVAQLLPAQDRFALVIGNGNYSSIPKLKNPVNDASDMADALRGLGFKVDLLRDANLGDMEAGVIRLGNQLGQSPGSYGFFFYAGHGIQSNGINYLIPADAQIAGEAFLKSKALAAQSVLDTLQQAGNGLNVVVLDACRDNPFSWARGGNRGLSVVGTQPPGSIIAYATSAGSVAQDGDGRNGLFTSQLLKHLRTPGLEIKEVFNRTGADVVSVSNNKQVPAIYNQFFKSAWLAGAQEEKPLAQAAAPSRAVTVSVKGAEAWKGSGIRLEKGQAYSISTVSGPEGGVNIAVGLRDGYWDKFNGPAGAPRGETPRSADKANAGTYPLPDAPVGSLAGRIGADGPPFLVGSGGSFVAASAGELFFEVNDSKYTNNAGSLSVTVTRSGDSSASAATPGTALPATAVASAVPETGIPRRGLVSEWLFNGDTKDSVKRRTGKVVDVTLGSDRFGRDRSAGYFNGTTSGIDMGAVFTKPMSEWSVSLWFDLAALTRTQRQVEFTRSPLLSNWNRWIQGAQRGWIWEFGYNSKYNQASMDVVTCDGKMEKGFGSPASNSDSFEKGLKDRWVHACLVVKNGKGVMYLDGSVSQAGSAATAMVPDPDSPLWMGRSDIDRDDKGNPVDFFNGAIDDVRLYDRALEDDEVLALIDETPESSPVAVSTASMPLPRKGLVSEWLFNGDTKDSVKRRAGKVIDVMLGQDRFGKDRAAGDFNGRTSAIDAGRIFEKPVPEWSVSVWYMARSLYHPAPAVGVSVGILVSNWNRWVAGGQKGFQFGHFVNTKDGGAALSVTVCDGARDGMFGVDWKPLPEYEAGHLGKWMHACLVVKGTVATIYLDGVKAGVGKVAGPMVPDLDTALWIGHSEMNKEPTKDGGWRDINYFDGALDDIRIYDRALGEDEVLALLEETPESTPVVAAPAPVPPPRNGLVSEWLFNGDTKDSVKRRLGKVADVTLGSDRFGQESHAAGFNGSTSYIDMGRLFQNPVREMSASLWFFMERLTRSSSPKVQMTRSPLISNWNKYVEGGQKGIIWNFMFGENYQFGGMSLAFNDGRSQVAVSLDRLAKADLEKRYVGRWIHACFVMKDSQASVYIDGVLATRQKAVAEMVPEDSPVYLGRSDVDNDGIAGSGKPIDFFTGSIDDVRIYDRALEEDEVLALFEELR